MVYNNGKVYDVGAAFGKAAVQMFKAMSVTIKNELKMRQLLPEMVLIGAKAALASAYAAATAGYAEALTSFVATTGSAVATYKQTSKLGEISSLEKDRSNTQNMIDQSENRLEEHQRHATAGVDDPIDRDALQEGVRNNKSKLEDIKGKMSEHERSFRIYENVHQSLLQAGNMSGKLISASANMQSELARSAQQSATDTYRTVEASAQGMSTTNEAILRPFAQMSSWTAVRA